MFFGERAQALLRRSREDDDIAGAREDVAAEPTVRRRKSILDAARVSLRCVRTSSSSASPCSWAPQRRRRTAFKSLARIVSVRVRRVSGSSRSA